MAEIILHSMKCVSSTHTHTHTQTHTRKSKTSFGKCIV